ncbi:AsmA family protein [Pseudooceanicola spongiae]|uniref:AsmA family protein n=1 Tax=Pseudooceanicola spongiae TaxID=2613965 RepID=A0A7L9WQJ3_9RHOB|nr:AsmA family protein [Pseudooceanicola spongiae]QOL82581.1 AsmA family protein [Pseudooceanicola spongiae]
MRVIRRILGFVVVLVVVLALFALGAVFLLPGERIARIAADQIEARTGRALTISGDTSVSFYPNLGVETGPVQLANADWSGNGPMFQAQALKIGVDVRALIGGDIRITTLEATEPRILLEKTADGRANWDLFGTLSASDPSPAPTGAEAPAPRGFGLERAMLSGAALRYVDPATQTDTLVQGVDLDLRLPDYNGPADLDMVLHPAGEAVTLTGHIERFADLVNGAVSATRLALVAPGGEAHFDGSFGLTPEAQGALRLNLADTSRFLAALGNPGVALPQGLGQSAQFTGQMTFAEGRVSLRGGRVTLDDNALDVSADVALGDVPQVTARLVTGTLDLSGLGTTAPAASGGATGAGGAPAEGWSRAPIDASALALFNGDVSLKADVVNLGVTQLSGVDTLISVDRARAVADIRSLSAFGGALSGQVVANNRAGLSVAANLGITGVDLARLLRETAGITRFTGAADGRVDLLATGNSMAAWMSSLSGTGTLSTGQGTIAGIDLDKLFRTGAANGGTTIFDQTSASFLIADGVLRNNDLSMKLASIQATGKGTVDLGGRAIDYLFTPTLLRTGEQNISVPVRIKGPWASPRIIPDLEQALQSNFDINKGDVKKEAQDKLRKEVQDKLGVQQQQGESSEDAIRRGIEEKLRGSLKGLFK